MNNTTLMCNCSKIGWKMTFSENYVIYGRMIILKMLYIHRQMKRLYRTTRSRFCIKQNFNTRDLREN